MANFIEYLKSLRSSVGKLDTSTKLHITVGNESCDMDSVASALAHAYFVSQTLRGDEFSLPLLQCDRADLRLRQDILWLFNELGIDPDTLIYQDDITVETLSGVGELSITLVDHSSPCGLLESLKLKIVEVIDHHELSGATQSENGVKLLIEDVGSCSTLVAEKIISDNVEAVDEKVAVLLLASILLDTGNLKMEGRVTEKDCAVAAQLLQRAASVIDQAQLYLKLFKQRVDITQLTTLDVLRKDFKVAHIHNVYSMGFCTVTSLLSEFLKRSNIREDLTSFYEANKLDALMLLGVHVSDCEGTEKKRRQIAIFRPLSAAALPVPHLLESLASVLEDDPDLKCDCIHGNVEDFDGVLMEQGNVSVTRKQIIPKITKFVASVESDISSPDVSTSPVSAAVLDHEHSVPLEPTVTVLTKPGNEEECSEAVRVSYKTEEVPKIPEYSFKQEAEDLRKHRLVQIGGEEKNIDMDIVQPYRKIIQHAGYVGPQRQALVVISACYLPPHCLPNYSEVIEHVFFYIMSVLDKLVMDEYIIIYLHSGAPHSSMPSIRVFHKFYKMVDRRLRKKLMHMYIVHPTFWVKTMIRLARPIISGKFWRKVHFIATLQDLSSYISIDEDFIAAPVLAVDQAIMSRQPSRRRYLPERQAASIKQ